MPTLISYLVDQHALPAIYFRSSWCCFFKFQSYHSIYWLCYDNVYFKCSCVLNWINYLTFKIKAMY